MSNAPNHFNQKFAGQVREWAGTDSEARFNNHVNNPETREKLRQMGWLNMKIHYRYNSEGFRDEEFDQRPAYIALGCSHTQGVGIPEPATWPKQLENLLNIKVWNLGVGGSAADTCFRLLDYWIHHLNVLAVVCAVPPILRFEVFDANHKWMSILHDHRMYQLWLQGYVKNYFSFDESSELNRKKNLMAMQHICDTKGIPFYYNTLETFGGVNMARDLAHCGVEANRSLAAEFHTQITGEKI